MQNNNLLKATIRERGVTQCHLAKELGISDQSLSLKINGKSDFKLSEIKRLKALLHLTTAEVIGIFFGSDVAAK